MIYTPLESAPIITHHKPTFQSCEESTLNKIIPATSCLNQKKSGHQELTELNTILLEKLLSTESCS